MERIPTGAGGRIRAFLLVLLLFLGLGSTGCRAGESAQPLADAFPSKEALVGAVLAALASGDRDALAALRVTRDEYHDLFWPELPESAETSFEFAWSLNDGNSRKALDRALRIFGGERYALVSITFAEEPEAYPGFTFFPGARVMVRRVRDGAVGELPIFDVFALRDGHWKLVNFDE